MGPQMNNLSSHIQSEAWPHLKVVFFVEDESNDLDEDDQEVAVDDHVREHGQVVVAAELDRGRAGATEASQHHQDEDDELENRPLSIHDSMNTCIDERLTSSTSLGIPWILNTFLEPLGTLTFILATISGLAFSPQIFSPLLLPSVSNSSQLTP